jgi:hypothetical protein
MLKSVRVTYPERKAKNSLRPRGRASKSKSATPTKWGARETESTDVKRVGAGAAAKERAQPESKILELFLIVSRGSGGGEKIFPNMEKSAVKPRFFKTEHLFCFAAKVRGGRGRTS